jgi:hypothetical protein
MMTKFRELTDPGIRFVSPMEALDLTTSSGRALPGIQAIFDEFKHETAFFQQVLLAIADHRVDERTDRFEPRMADRRPKSGYRTRDRSDWPRIGWN